MSIGIELISGAAAGLVGTVLGFPFDTIKTRMQTFPDQYRGIRQSISIIYRNEGFHGLYRGVGPPLCALTILNMMNFTVYSTACKFFAFKKEDRTLLRAEPTTFLAGGVAGISAALVSTPFELVKIQMQLDSHSMAFKGRGSIFSARKIFELYGLRGLYRGHAINTAREILFLGTYFFVYEHSKHLLLPFLPIPLAISLSGGLSGSIGWLVSYPLDCVKGNIQGSSISTQPPRAKDVAARLYAAKGLSGLYIGVGASLARAFIVSSSRFLAYEFAQWSLRR